MNWDAIGAIGEITGALAVVGSLIYLGTQIRNSNIASKQAAMREILQESLTFLGRVGSDTSTASVWARGLSQNESLTDAESMQFGALCIEITQIWERGHYLGKSSDLELHLVHTMQSNLERIAGAPGFQSWFEARGSSFSDEFVQLVSKKIQDSNGYVTWEKSQITGNSQLEEKET